jgi:hypothetical protein
MNEFSAKDFGEFEEQARKLGITPSQLLKSIITGKSTEEIKRDFIRATWPNSIRKGWKASATGFGKLGRRRRDL